MVLHDMNQRFKNLKLNSSLAITYQVVLIFSGFILPRCFLLFYGSEINGLISSITEFLSFINICDLGMGAVVAAELYKPLSARDTYGISRVFLFAQRFFRIIGVILIGYIVVLLFVYPKMMGNRFTPQFTITLILSMSVSHFGQFFLGISYQLLLNADQKSYVQIVINGCTVILNTVFSVVFMYLGFSVQIVKLITSLIYLLRPICMFAYVKRHYVIDVTVKVDGSAIPQKWNGVIQHLAYMIYKNTDVIVLSVFSSLSNVSIYSVYTLVVSAIRSFINAATTGIQALFGNMIATQEKENLQRLYDIYDWGLHTVSVLLFTVTALLIVPFIMIYTANVNDANYYVPIFGILIVMAYFVNTIRDGMYIVVRSAGHFKQTQMAALLEACLNLGLSIILVFHFGLVGVVTATLLAATFFTVYEMIYLSNHILNRPIKLFIRQIILDCISIFVMALSTSKIEIYQLTYISWLGMAVKIFFICAVEIAALQLIFENKKIVVLLRKLGMVRR